MEGPNKKYKQTSAFDAIYAAILKKDKQAVEQALLEHDSEAMPDGETELCLNVCAINGLSGPLKVLLKDDRFNPSTRNTTLYNAVEGGHVKILKIVLKDGRADPGISNPNVLESAASWGNLYRARLLLSDPRTNVVPVNKAVENAYTFKHYDVVRYLLGHVHGVGIDPESALGQKYLVRTWDWKRDKWRFFPRYKRKVYVEFLACLKVLKFAPYFRDLHDTIMSYYFSQHHGGGR